MMKLVLIEDEPLAMEQLRSMIQKWDGEFEIQSELESLEEARTWFSGNDWPDLILSDIQLSDGLSLQLFKDGVPSHCKIVFITAFDQYAIDAFKLQAQDYLLKPIEIKDLHDVLDRNQSRNKSAENIDYELLASRVIEKLQGKKKTYLIRFKQQLIEIPSDDIALIFVEDRSIMCKTFEGRKLPMDLSIEQFDNELDPDQFFRANRSCIINHKAISSIKSYSHSKLLIETDPEYPQGDLVISKEKTPLFKKWLATRKDFKL